MATAFSYPQEIEDFRLLRPAQVYELIGFSASRVRQLEEAGEFPKRFPLGAHAVAWRAKDIRAWVDKRAAVGTFAGKGAAQKKPAGATAKPTRKAVR